MPADPDLYTTLSESSQYEPDKIKGSRFIACLAPAETVEEAQAFLASVRAEYADARHVCYAWRIGAIGDVTRSSDDGEPSGSAGRPILLQIEGHEVTNAVACVVRYFGGVKLGVGGLMRAYGGAAGQALDRATLRHVEVKIALHCVHPYDDSGIVRSVLSAHDLKERDAEYTDEVAFTVDVAKASIDIVMSALRDATGARARLSRGA